MTASTQNSDAPAAGDANETLVNVPAGADALAETAGGDTLRGTVGPDTLVGGAGSDSLAGGAGSDSLRDHWGDDILDGGDGDDELTGGWGNDTLAGGSGADSLLGGKGEDAALYRFDGSVGVNFAATGSGGAQDDGTGSVDVFEEIEEVHVFGTPHNDTLAGDSQRNWLAGGAGDDVLTGGGGRDTFSYDLSSLSVGSLGVDLIADLSIGDEIEFRGALAFGVRSLGTGKPAGTLVRGDFDFSTPVPTGDGLVTDLHVGVDAVPGADLHLRLKGAISPADLSVAQRESGALLLLYQPAGEIQGTTGPDELQGFARNDTLRGMDGNDTLRGFQGDDRLEGGAGNDVLIGMQGADSVTGGEGDDFAWLSDEGQETVDGGGGIDSAVYDFRGETAAVEFVAAESGLEPLPGGSADLLSSIEELHVTGGSGSDRLTGNSLVNHLSGGEGSDTLTGGAGLDRFSVYQFWIQDHGRDLVRDLEPLESLMFDGLEVSRVRQGEGAGLERGHVAIGAYEAASGTTPVRVGTNEVPGADLVFDLVGAFSASDFQVRRDEYSNGMLVYLRSGATEGPDYVDLGAGAEVHDGLGGDDATWGRGGNDILWGSEGRDTLAGGTGGDTLHGGQDEDLLAGDEDADLLAGDGGSDTLEGGNGYDTLDGGTGADVLSGGKGTDHFINLADGHDDTVDGDQSYGIAVYTLDHTAGVDFALTGASGLQADGLGGVDMLVSVDEVRVRGTAHNDTLSGDGQLNWLEGGGGDDVLHGGGVEDGFFFDSGDVFFFNLAQEGGVPDLGVDLIAGLAPRDLINLGGAFPPDLRLVATSGRDPGSLLQGEIDFAAPVAQGGDFLTTLRIGADAAPGADLEIRVGGRVGPADFVLSREVTGDAVLRYEPALELQGEEVHDDLYGLGNNDTLRGAGGDDSLSGQAGNDLLDGGTGNDSLVGGRGADSMAGGVGDDLFAMYGPQPDGEDTVDGGSGRDTVLYDFSGSTGPGIVFKAGEGATQPDSLGGSDLLLSVEQIDAWGSLGADLLVGNARTNILDGREGNDTLTGGAGVDTFALRWTSWIPDAPDTGRDLITDLQVSEILDYPFLPLHGVGAGTGAGLLSGEVALAYDPAKQLTSVSVGVDSIPGADLVTDLAGLFTAADFQLRTVGVHSRLVFLPGGAATAGADVLGGGPSADMVDGLAGDDTLDGSAGADTLQGGEGQDTARYAGAPSGVKAEIWTRRAASDGWGATDTLLGLEDLVGSPFGDLLAGDIDGNLLDGAGSNDSLYGGTGNDTMTGGPGADLVDAGPGIDTGSYAAAPAGAVVELWTGRARSDGHGSNDIVVNVENVLGSAFGDLLAGDIGSNLLDGASGNDSLYGGMGSDTVLGGAGADFIDAGAGIDTASYASAAAGVVVELWAHRASSDGEGGTDTIVGVEHLVGSGFADLLAGTVGNDSLEGGGGSDALYGGTGNDSLAGGEGGDTFYGHSGGDLFQFRAGSGADVLWDFKPSEGDKIQLTININGSAIVDGASALAATTSEGGNAVIHLGGGNSITLVGVAKAAMAAGDFSF